MTENTTIKQGSIPRVLLFILIVGIFYGLLQLLNFSFVYVIGYGAIYTGIITSLLTMLILLKLYMVYLKKEMTFLDTFLVGLPVFAVGTIICFLVVDYDFEGAVIHSYYANGYFLHLIEESSEQFIPTTLVFALIFAPTYRFIKRKRIIS